MPSAKAIFETAVSVGEFDPSVDGAYRNVKLFPMEVKRGKLFISVNSDRPVDMALSNSDGICIKFKNSILCDTIGPIEVSKKEMMTLLVGVFRGDMAELSIRAWME